MTPPTPEYCLFCIDWWPMCMAKSEWANWVQAVFSVVAIVAAIWISVAQRSNAEREARASRHAAATVAGVAVRRTLSPLNNVLHSLSEALPTAAEATASERAERYRKLVDPLKLPTEDQMMALHLELPTIAEDLAVANGAFRDIVLALNLISDRRSEAGNGWTQQQLLMLQGAVEMAHAGYVSARRKLNAFLGNRVTDGPPMD